MKGISKYLVSGFLVISGSVSVNARSLEIWENGICYSFESSEAGEMLFEGDDVLMVEGHRFVLNGNMMLKVSDEDIAAGNVVVRYSDDGAQVLIAGNLAEYVTGEVSGGHVSLVQSSDVDETTCGEITYTLSGKSADGSLLLTGSYKSTVACNGLDLTNPGGAAIEIANGKRIDFSIKNGTVNTLTDGAGGSQKGCIVCKGHLELKGKGELNIYGNVGHGIQAKEYIEMKNCKVNVLSAVKDGINCNQYFLLESGELSISGTGDDALQCSYKDDENRGEEDTGTITIAGGRIKAEVTARAAKALKADGNIYVKGGELDLTTTGGGLWDESKSKTKASSCLGADGEVIISDGTIILTSGGSGGKGISCDGNLTIEGGDITINTSGGVFAYVNGTAQDNYTGNTDRLASDQKSSSKGIKVDGEIIINGGRINAVSSGKGAEGIESKSTLTINDGEIYVKANDDAINSSGHLYINGGDITVISTGNDGLDSNGNLYISGGVIRSFGAGSPECGIDANEEEGYTVYLTGGKILAVGGSNSVPTKDDSTQPYVSGSGTVTASTVIELRDGEEVLVSFTVPESYTSSTGSGGRPGGSRGSSILVSCPGMETGQSYTLINGETQSTVTSQLKGNGGWRPW